MNKQLSKDRNRVSISTFGILLKLFGPLRYEDGKEHILTRMMQIVNLPYGAPSLHPHYTTPFHSATLYNDFISRRGFRGFMEADEAGRLLGDKQEGSYIIRFSTRDPVGYAISRVAEQGGGIKHTKVFIKQDTREVYVSEKGRMYPNLPTLLAELQDSLGLKHPIGGGVFQKLHLGDEVIAGYEAIVEDVPAEPEPAGKED